MQWAWESVCSLEHVRVAASAAVAVVWMVVSAVAAVVRACREQDNSNNREPDGAGAIDAAPYRIALLSLV